MLEFIRNIFIIVVLTKVGLSILKFMFSAKARRKSAIFYRVKKIINNQLCKPLDKIIDKQETEKVIAGSPKIIKMPKKQNLSNNKAIK